MPEQHRQRAGAHRIRSWSRWRRHALLPAHAVGPSSGSVRLAAGPTRPRRCHRAPGRSWRLRDALRVAAAPVLPALLVVFVVVAAYGAWASLAAS